MHIIFGLFGGDAPWQVLDTETGTLTSHGGGYRVGAEEFKHAVQSLKHAADVKDPEFRRAVVKAASPDHS